MKPDGLYPFPSYRRARHRRRVFICMMVFLAAAGLFWLGKSYIYDRRSLCSGADLGSSCVEVYGNPTVTRIEPGAGDVAGGTDVTISGTMFGPGVKVWFGDTLAAGVVVKNYHQLVAVAPKAQWPGAVDIGISRGTGPRHVLKNGYRYTGYLSVTSLTPAMGPAAGGTAVTVIGSGFAPDTKVYFGDVRVLRVAYVDQNTLRILVPRHQAGGTDIRITTGDQTAVRTAAFTYQ